MKLFFTLVFLISSAIGQVNNFEFEKLVWLSGCWELNKNDLKITEQWMKPFGNTMLGMSRTVKNNVTMEYEFLQIYKDEIGDIYYVAMPSGQEKTRFKLVWLSDDEAVFENFEHDFPQRIRYFLNSSETLEALISGNVNGNEKEIKFSFNKVRCD